MTIPEELRLEVHDPDATQYVVSGLLLGTSVGHGRFHDACSRSRARIRMVKDTARSISLPREKKTKDTLKDEVIASKTT